MKPCLVCQGLGNLGEKDKAFSLETNYIENHILHAHRSDIHAKHTRVKQDGFLEPREHPSFAPSPTPIGI